MDADVLTKHPDMEALKNGDHRADDKYGEDGAAVLLYHTLEDGWLDPLSEQFQSIQNVISTDPYAVHVCRQASPPKTPKFPHGVKAMWGAQFFIYAFYMFYGCFVYGYQGQYVSVL